MKASTGTFKILSVGTALCSVVFLSACMSGGNLGSANLANGTSTIGAAYVGCVSGKGLDASRILLNYQFPATADRVNVYRNGLIAYSSTDPTSSNFTDIGLLEGASYEYSCEMVQGTKSKVGSQVLNVSTISTTAPIFAGIVSATAVNANSVFITWAVPTSPGPLAKSYQIFTNTGSSMNWTASPYATSNAGINSMTITNLGDQLPYSFGVRACNNSNICDLNTAKISLTMSDNGPPTTTGILSYTASNGSVLLNVPWQPSNGQIAKRKVYQKTGGPAPLTIADMSLVLTNVVSDYTAPATNLTISGILDNTQYYFVVQDEDSLGQSNQNFNVLSLNSGDMTAPIFTGITSLAVGIPSSSSLTAGFTAIAREGIESLNGASQYLIYTTSALYPAVPLNACTSGTLSQTISSVAYPPGAATVTLAGLSERTTYAVCIKAQDLAGNTSVTTSYLTATTLDITPPNFDGIQSISFNPVDSSLNLAWNPSPSADILSYRIQIWKNTTAPIPSQITTLDRIAATYPSSAVITSSTFSYGSLDTIYAVINACDTAASLPGGTQNCTTYALSTSKSVTLPDFQPPVGFPGIKSSSNQVSPSQGAATISWYPPTTWTASYYGFRIYSVNKTTGTIASLLKTCNCVTPGACTTATDTSCTVTGLDAARSYRFHVRAINSAGFETAYLDPSVSNADLLTEDTTPPTFNSGVTAGAGPTFPLSWNAATDNMYLGDGATMQYQLWRKAGTTFATPTNPSIDGSLRTTTAALTYTDSGFSDSSLYFYTVCALDSSGNRTCDGTVTSFLTADTTPPILSAITTSKVNYSPLKSWSLSWMATDNLTPANMIRIKIYQTITSLPSTATIADPLIFSQLGVSTATGLTGPLGVKKFINYLVVASDQAGNSTSQALTISSDNTMSITAVTRNTGLTSGGDWIVVDGTGFSLASSNGLGTSTTIYVGGNLCSNITVVSTGRIACQTPAGTAGAASIAAVNPEGSSVSQNGLFTYQTVSINVCDNPSTWPSNNETAGGTGTSGNPFIICTPAQFANIGKLTSDGVSQNYLTGGYYWQLGQNINFANVPQTTFGGAWGHNFNSPQIDGSGYSIMNYSIVNLVNAEGGCGLIYGPQVNTNASFTLQNIRFLNISSNCATSPTYNTHPEYIFIGLIMGDARSNFYNGNSFILSNVEIYGNMNVKLTNSAQTGVTVGVVSARGASDGYYDPKTTTTMTNSIVNVTATIDPSSAPGSSVNFGTFGYQSNLVLSNSQFSLNFTSARAGNDDHVYGIGAISMWFGNTQMISNIDFLFNADGASWSAFQGFAPNGGNTSAATAFDHLRVRMNANLNILNTTSAGAVLFEPQDVRGLSNISQVGAHLNFYQNLPNNNFIGFFIGYPLSYPLLDFRQDQTTITDSYVTGTNNGANLLTSGSFISVNASTLVNNVPTSTLNINRFFQVAKFNMIPQSNDFFRNYQPSAVNITNTFWDYQVAGASASDSGYGAGVTGEPSSAISNQAPGNIFTTAGFDFTPTTGNWQWCPSIGYPMLQIEPCP